MFAAPPERDLEWSDEGVEGSWRFLNRVWRLIDENREDLLLAKRYDGVISLSPDLKNIYRKTHQTIKKVTEDIEERFHFNTAISAIMELFNTMSGIEIEKDNAAQAAVMRSAMESLALLLSPIVPHFAEELWEALGYESSILLASWPTYRKDALEKDELLIVVQVNGKLRSRFNADVNASDDSIKEMALADEKVKKFIGGKPIKKMFVVKNKLVNIVV